MTTTYNTQEIHDTFCEIAKRLVFSRLKTLYQLNMNVSKQRYERLTKLMTIFSFNPIITIPDGSGDTTTDLETRIVKCITSFEDKDADAIGVTEHDLLMYELKELSYSFLAQIDSAALSVYFEHLCGEEKEAAHYNQGFDKIYKSMVVLAVIIKTSEMYSEFFEAMNLGKNKSKREPNV
jgi:hypothetical protein